MKAYMAIFMALLIVGTALAGAVHSKELSYSKIVFYVQWYSVGKAALEGLKGVKKVTSGFKGFREINTVTYDAGIITPDEMVSALKNYGTYIGIADE